MKRIRIKDNVINYIQKKSVRKTISALVNKDGVLEVRTPRSVDDGYVRDFIERNGDRILGMLEKSRQITEYESKLGTAKTAELRQMAKDVIPKRVEYYSNLMGVRPTAVKINSARTRFGSCSAKGSLNFSCRVMAYSADAVDYVVVHELAHLVHMDHSADFWRLVEMYKPDFQSARRELEDIPQM